MLRACDAMALPTKILVPTDFGAGSDHALTYAVELARALGAEITVMHAYELPMLGFPDGALLATPDLASRIAEGAQIGLRKAVASVASSGVALKTVLKQGATWRAIVDVATELDVGMIVMGTHGRHGLPRALLGSVAEKVVRTAPCPVLTMHVDDTRGARDGGAK
jgi:nucleotide-binding universal stress UspA family protein